MFVVLPKETDKIDKHQNRLQTFNGDKNIEKKENIKSGQKFIIFLALHK